MTDPVLWLNGTLTPQSQACINPLSPGLLFGYGLYESLRTTPEGTPLFVQRHHARLKDGARRLGLTPPTLEELTGAIRSLCEANGLRAARIRVTLTAAAGSTLPPTEGGPQDCLITAAPLPVMKPAAALITVPWRRNERSSLAGIKFTACAENLLAQRAALAAGADEALFLNTREEVCEGAFSNLFLVEAGRVLTPPLSSGCLPGITRELVLELCRAAGIPCDETDLPGTTLIPASWPESSRPVREAFLTTALRGIQPVERIDQWYFPAPGAVTRQLMEAYTALCSRNSSA